MVTAVVVVVLLPYSLGGLGRGGCCCPQSRLGSLAEGCGFWPLPCNRFIPALPAKAS